MEGFLAEHKNLKVEAPLDLNTAGLSGSRVAFKDAHRVAIVLNFGTSVGATVSVALKQHNAATAGVTKALAIDNIYFKKIGAATVFTKVQPEAKADTYSFDADLASAAGIVVLEVLAEDLDVNGGFNHISVDVADSAVAKLAAVTYVIDPKFKPAYELAI